MWNRSSESRDAQVAEMFYREALHRYYHYVVGSDARRAPVGALFDIRSPRASFGQDVRPV